MHESEFCIVLGEIPRIPFIGFNISYIGIHSKLNNLVLAKTCLLFGLISLGLYLQLPAQERVLSLKHKGSGYVYDVDPEKAVKYRLQDGNFRRGKIQDLSEEWMTINGEKVHYKDITMLSSWHTRKNASAKTGGALLTAFGGLLTAAGVIIAVEGFNTDNELGSAIAVPVGLVTSGVGVGTAYFGLRAMKRKRFDMMEWELIINHY